MPTLLAIVVAVAVALAAFSVWAQAAALADKGPFDPSLFVTYGWVVLISMLGGFASFYRKVKSGQARWFNFAEFVGELITSALAGLITFLMCRWAGVNDWLMAALVGIAGHMGSRALFLLEKCFERWAERTFGGAPTGPRPLDHGIEPEAEESPRRG